MTNPYRDPPADDARREVLAGVRREPHTFTTGETQWQVYERASGRPLGHVVVDESGQVVLLELDRGGLPIYTEHTVRGPGGTTETREWAAGARDTTVTHDDGTRVETHRSPDEDVKIVSEPLPGGGWHERETSTAGRSAERWTDDQGTVRVENRKDGMLREHIERGPAGDERVHTTHWLDANGHPTRFERVDYTPDGTSYRETYDYRTGEHHRYAEDAYGHEHEVPDFSWKPDDSGVSGASPEQMDKLVAELDAASRHHEHAVHKPADDDEVPLAYPHAGAH